MVTFFFYTECSRAQDWKIASQLNASSEPRIALLEYRRAQEGEDPTFNTGHKTVSTCAPWSLCALKQSCYVPNADETRRSARLAAFGVPEFSGIHLLTLSVVGSDE